MVTTAIAVEFTLIIAFFSFTLSVGDYSTTPVPSRLLGPHKRLIR